MPTIKQIQHFRAILKSGTTQSAARAVHISQPALTRSINNMEEELGLKLFERSKSGMSPTEFAEQIASRYEQVLLELEDIQREALLYRNLESGQIRIGFGQAVREPLSRHCLPTFVEQYPNIAITVREGTAPELARGLEQREVDLVIAGVASYSEYEFIESEHILDVPVQVMVRRDHPLTKRKHVALQDILEYPQAAPTSLGEAHPFRGKAELGRDHSLNPHFMCSDYSALESIVTRTEAWTVTLETSLHRDRPKNMSVLKVAGFDITIELSVIELKGRGRSPSANRLIQTIKSMLSDY
jgi:DNA-binding transcriptional LysR family regulator